MWHPNASKMGEAPKGLLRPQTIRVGLYEEPKPNERGPEIATRWNFLEKPFHALR